MLDLTPEGHMHQRIISVGKDPLLDTPHPLYVMSSTSHYDEKTAFSFRIVRHLEQKNEDKGNFKITIVQLLLHIHFMRLYNSQMRPK